MSPAPMSRTIPVAISDIHAPASILADVPTAVSAKPHPGLQRSGAVQWALSFAAVRSVREETELAGLLSDSGLGGPFI